MASLDDLVGAPRSFLVSSAFQGRLANVPNVHLVKVLKPSFAARLPEIFMRPPKYYVSTKRHEYPQYQQCCLGYPER